MAIQSYKYLILTPQLAVLPSHLHIERAHLPEHPDLEDGLGHRLKQGLCRAADGVVLHRHPVNTQQISGRTSHLYTE